MAPSFDDRYVDPRRPAFCRDIDVLRALYNRVNELRVLGGRTKAKRAAIKEQQVDFDDFELMTVSNFVIEVSSPYRGRRAFYFSLGCEQFDRTHFQANLPNLLTYYIRLKAILMYYVCAFGMCFTRLHLYVSRRLPGCSDWSCRVLDDFTLWTGLSSWRVYDGMPLIASAADVKWKALRARIMSFTRAAVVFLSILNEIEYRPGGNCPLEPKQWTKGSSRGPPCAFSGYSAEITHLLHTTKSDSHVLRVRFWHVFCQGRGYRRVKQRFEMAQNSDFGS
jgi:hypothetical protein